jgi:hypothetical protein
MGTEEPLVVCVPNFSEGRDLDVMDAICDALSSVPGASLVYRQADLSTTAWTRRSSARPRPYGARPSPAPPRRSS